jgi:hypothetical protein
MPRLGQIQHDIAANDKLIKRVARKWSRPLTLLDVLQRDLEELRICVDDSRSLWKSPV